MIVKLSHRPRRPPLFVAVAARRPPPNALLSLRISCCRCLPCRAAVAFVVVPPLASSGMAERQKEWQNGRVAEMAAYVLFMVHTNSNDNNDDNNNDDTLIFYITDLVVDYLGIT